ncbi:MAG: hypothetical protein H7144_04615 [Burkholderiales bacterium]|nr:hypothetical protein [Phycisphaerae bacterium]
MKPHPRRKSGVWETPQAPAATPPLADSEADEIEFAPLRDVFARPVRRPVEPGVLRSLLIAAVVGVGMGLFLWFFKPGPKSAEAAPVYEPKLMNTRSIPWHTSATPAPTGKSASGLFQLPEWDQAAFERDQLRMK